MRVAIVVGHDRVNQGAEAVDGIHEWPWNNRLAGQLGRLLDDSRVFYRPIAGNYDAQLLALTEEINRWGPDFVLSLHFNAAPEAYKGEWEGTAALHYPGSKKGTALARRLVDAVSKALGTVPLGAKPRTKSWNDVELYILTETIAPAVILETHFGDHPKDHRVATAARDSRELALTIAAVLS